jgi:hypothetical protein
VRCRERQGMVVTQGDVVNVSDYAVGRRNPSYVRTIQGLNYAVVESQRSKAQSRQKRRLGIYIPQAH